MLAKLTCTTFQVYIVKRTYLFQPFSWVTGIQQENVFNPAV